MTTFDNGEPMSDWQPDPRPSPFDDEPYVPNEPLIRAASQPRRFIRADETTYLTASPANAERLRASVARLNACPHVSCFVCQPHEGDGAYPLPANITLGEE